MMEFISGLLVGAWVCLCVVAHLSDDPEPGGCDRGPKGKDITP